MEKWDYYISGIWKLKTNDEECITHVFLHTATDGFGKGVKTSKDDVVALLEDGAKICTITWNYHLMQWRYGVKVSFGELDGETWLYTPPEASTFDDIESSIQMQYILMEQPATIYSNEN